MILILSFPIRNGTGMIRCNITNVEAVVCLYCRKFNSNKNVRSDSMERFILKKLLDWKDSPYRKPLILKGVRQVGKTWILKEFGRRCYENTAYFNFDENEEYKQFLKQPRM